MKWREEWRRAGDMKEWGGRGKKNEGAGEG